MRAIFLDRDGVVTKSTSLISDPKHIKIIRGASKAIRDMNKIGIKVIIITNQPVVARGITTEEGLDKIHKRLRKMLEPAKLDAIYYCPHHPESHHEDIPESAMRYRIECECRKPKPGMLQEAAKRFSLDLSQCFFVGDSTSDIAAAKNAGCKAILVETGNAGKDGVFDEKPDFTCENIGEAAKLVKRLVMIKAVILVGGRGERLKPLTDKIPKPLMPIGGRPLLEWQLRLLEKHGINEVIICGSYKFDAIKLFLKKRRGIKVKYSKDLGIGTAPALKAAKNLIANDFVVLNGDIATNMDLSQLINFHVKNDGIGTLVIRETDHPMDSDSVVLDGDRITSIVPKGKFVMKNEDKIMGITGIFAFKKGFINILSNSGSIEHSIIGGIKKPFYGLQSKDYIRDMGTHKRYEQVQNDVMNEKWLI